MSSEEDDYSDPDVAAYETSGSSWHGTDLDESEDEEEQGLSDDASSGQMYSIDGDEMDDERLAVPIRTPRLAMLGQGEVKEGDSDFSDSEIEEVLLGLTDLNTNRKKKKRKRRRTLPYSGKKSNKMHRRSAAAPSKMSDKAIKLLEEANDAFLANDNERAIMLAKQVVAEAPQAHEPLHLLGSIYLMNGQDKGDQHKALGYYFVAATYVKTDLAAWKHVGDLACELDDVDVAIYCYRRVVPVTKQSTDIDQECAYHLAQLFLTRLDHRRAAIYYIKLLRCHPGDPYLSLELAKCLYNVNEYAQATAYLEESVAATIGTPNDLFNQDFRFVPKEAPPMVLDPNAWRVLEMLAGLYIEGKHYDQCIRVCQTMFRYHVLPRFQDPVMLEEAPYSEDVRDFQLPQVALLSLGPALLARYAAALICTHHPEAENTVAAATLCIGQTVQANPDFDAFPLFVALADSYLEVSEPQKALTMYTSISERQRRNISDTRNAEFYIKIAKCYLQMKEFELAAQLLESVLPRSRPTADPEGATVGDVASKVREYEARLLLFKVLQNMDQSTKNSDNDRLDTIGDDPTRLATRDNRISALEIGSSIIVVPEPVSALDRELIVLRLKRGLKRLNVAMDSITCQTQFDAFLTELRSDEFPRPKVALKTVETLLSGHYYELFSNVVNAISAKNDQVTESDLLSAVASQQTDNMGGPQCTTCGGHGCRAMVTQFVSLLRRLWLSEFLLVARDSLLDTRRVLSESSRLRAVELSRHLQKARGFLGESATQYTPLSDDTTLALISPDPDTEATPLALEDEKDPSDERVEARFHTFEKKFVIKVKPKFADTEFRRRRDTYMRGGLSAKVNSHQSLRKALSLASLEDLLGWDDFGMLLLEGTRLLLCENGGRIAVDLIENALMNVRFSRAQGPDDYAEKRALFRATARRISLRTALHSQMMRLALSGFRQRLLLPLLRDLIKSNTHNKWATMIAFQSGVGVYSNILFNEAFAHHSVTSISASKERDVISFNRAWCTRHLMTFPHSFSLTMMVAHYCLFSMRWPYAVAEYTRALHLKPWNPVASLCLAASTLSFATSRGVQDRHHVVLRGLALLQRFIRLRNDLKQLEISRLNQWMTMKLEGVFQAFRTLDKCYEERFATMFRRLMVPGTGAPKGADYGPVVVKVMSTHCVAFLKKVQSWTEAYYEAECSYNQARAYQHLSLDYLAYPLYTKVLSDLRDVRDQLSQTVLGSYFTELTENLIVLRGYPCPAPAVVEFLINSDFPPATDSRIRWPKGHRDLEIFDHVESMDEFCAAIMFAQLRSPVVEARVKAGKSPLLYEVVEPASPVCRNPDRLLFPKIVNTEAPKKVWPVTQTTRFPATELMAEVAARQHKPHPLEGLFADNILTDRHVEALASDVLDTYISNTPPVFFILGLDVPQLSRCCAINLHFQYRKQHEDVPNEYINTKELVWG